jgi:tRNA threonylcarbamoyladenosine biosynthesis protein TsaE
VIDAIQREIGLENNFFLKGPLGGGKTTFVRTLCRKLNVEVNVTSPSFTLMQTYPYKDGTIYHLDLYRLEDPGEAYEIGLEEVLAEPGIKLVEWMDKFPEFMKDGYIIEFKINPDETRNITLKKVEL